MAEIIDNNSQLSEKSDNNGTSESSPINNRHILNESLKIVLVLGVLALIAAILLSVVNYYTKIDASVIIRETIGQSYSSSIKKEINIDNLSQYSGTEIIKAYEAEDGAIIIVSKALKGEKVCYNADGITIIVVIKDNKLIKIVPFAHSETPGLGEKALKEDHLRQYEGLSTQDFYIQTGESISSGDTDNYFNPTIVSGATYSSNGVNLAVKAAVRTYNIIIGDQL
jgi:Na+-translocating ferredoxin:NAD+ oxidoreductase RnfG subunit